MKSIADDEILRGIEFSFDHSDIVSEVTVEFSAREQAIDDRGRRANTVTVRSDSGRFLHEASATKRIESVWAFYAEAERLARRLGYILGERRGVVSFRTKNRFYTVTLGDTIEIERERLPGFVVTAGITRTRTHAVFSYQKGRTEVTLELDDRKGIEDNSGVW
jgi:hypothetical protein